MNFSELFIRRPVATSLLMLAIALFGFVAYRGLPVSDLPNVDFPTIYVSASLPGANPDTMASAVATPLEKQFSTIEGLDSMTSTSTLGSTSITLQFSLNRKLDDAALDVQSAITRASSLLPAGMPNPPTFRKVNPADSPILFLALTSDTMPLYDLSEYAETMMAQRISMVSGVAQVSVFGSAKYAVRVQLDPRALASKGIGVDEIKDAIGDWNVNSPTGELYGPHKAYTIKATGQLTRADRYRPMVVAYRNGSPVRLQDVARVFDSIEDDKIASWYNDETGSRRAINLAVQRQPGENTIEVANSIKALLPSFRSQLPPSVNLNILYDRSQSIRDSFEDVQFTMILTLGLVILVIFLFLRNVSATVIPSLALPFSIIGTFAIMYLFNYSLNNLSMMALILSVGYVVDDAIVMLENIVRHMEHGEGALQAALSGSREIGFTIISMTLSLAAVFIPVLFLGGIVGRLFREFAVTITVAILISGLVSVTLTPMLSSRFLRPPEKQQKRSRFYNVTERIFDGMLSFYARTLRWTLKFRPVTLAVSVALLIATFYLFVAVPKGFIPSEDTDQISVVTEAPQGVSPSDQFAYQQAAAEIFRNDPNVARFMSSTGGTSGSLGGPNFGRMTLRLKPRSERELSADEIIEHLRPKLAAVPGLRIYLQNPPTIRIGGRLSRSLYQFTLQGSDINELYRSAQALEREMSAMPELQDVSTDLQLQKPQVNVTIDRDKAASLRLTADQIESALYSTYGPRWVSTIYAPDNQYRVVMESQPEFQTNPNALSMLYVRSSVGNLVPLSSVAQLTETLGPQSINHSGQLPSVTLTFNLKPGVSLGESVDKIQEVVERTVPSTISAVFQGTAQAFQQSFRNLWVLLIVAILVVYIVLGILYESYVHPITILSGLPSAGFGALLTLLLFRVELNIYSFVGLIMLIGIVKKNAIMQIDFALTAERQQGMKPMDAIYQGCLIRFRPIMMTTMAALLGAVPIALGYGAGGEARQPLGLAVVGGLLFSQLVTLYLTPVYYTYLASLQNWFKNRRSRGAGTLHPDSQPIEAN
ncbi:MAG: efflux RND transporter permease subunit [Bryobacteraceae bacterium]